MFGALCEHAYFVTSNDVAKVNISYNMRTVPKLLYGSEVPENGI
jgi:hypothetical protein